MQMERVAKHLESEPLAAIYASPLRRATESASIIASLHACGVEQNAGLREINFGDFEGLTYDEIAARHPELYRQWMDTPTEIQFPNGENFSEMRARVLCAFESIRRSREGQTIAIVTHSGVIRIVISWALQMPNDCIFRIAQDYGAMNMLGFVDGIATVQSMNVTWPTADAEADK
jgi:alpha-ribazole phosphatase